MAILPLVAGLFGALPSLGLKTYLTIAALIILSLTALTGYVKGRAGEAAAIAENNLTWTTKLQTAKDDHARELAEARRLAAAEPATPADRAERLRLCRASPTCRDRGPGKR